MEGGSDRCQCVCRWIVGWEDGDVQGAVLFVAVSFSGHMHGHEVRGFLTLRLMTPRQAIDGIATDMIEVVADE